MKIYNNTNASVTVYYNSKMCFASDASGWKNLKDVSSASITPNGCANVSVKENWFASIVLAIFSVLLFINFLLVGIDCRKKEMGILRAIGARSIDTVVICLVQSAIVAIIDFILSLIGVSILCLLINKFFYISLFFVGPLQIFILFALCIVGTALSAILPAMKIAKKKSIDVINNI